MLKITEQEIMNTSQHQFIYGYNTKERTQFLKQMAQNYPVKLEHPTPIGIYLEKFYLPQISDTIRSIDLTILTIINREYLNLSIALSVIDTIIRQVNLEALYDKMFLDIVNRYFLNKNFNKMKDLEELSSMLKTTQILYENAYIDFIAKGIFNLKYEALPIRVLDIDIFISWLKKTIGLHSYFCMIADVHEKIPLLSQMALNSLVTKRINRDISMKIVCEISQWDTFYDLDDTLANYLHDYDIVDLDGSVNKYIRKRKI